MKILPVKMESPEKEVSLSRKPVHFSGRDNGV